VREIALALSNVLGIEISPLVTGKYRAGDIRHCFADISAARELLAYEPRITFADGIRELVEWLHCQEANPQANQFAEAAAKQLDHFGLTA